MVCPCTVPIEVGVDPPKSNLKGYVKPIYNDEGEKEETEDHKSEEH